MHERTERFDIPTTMEMRHGWRADVPKCLNHAIGFFLGQQGGALLGTRFDRGLLRVGQSSVDVGISDLERRFMTCRESFLSLVSLVGRYLHRLFDVGADRLGNRRQTRIEYALPDCLPGHRLDFRQLGDLLVQLGVALVDRGTLFRRNIGQIAVLRLLPRMRIEGRFEASHQPVVISLRQWVVFVVVTATALQRQPQDRRREHVERLIDDFVSLLNAVLIKVGVVVDIP